MTLKRRITVLASLSSIVGGVVVVYYMPHWQQTQAASKAGRRGGPPAVDPVPVLAAAAQSADVPVYLDGVGTARALNTVTVRSQVDGKLISILFKEGEDVPKGFVLAKIDPTTYQAQYDQAVATKAKAEAQLANARLDSALYRLWRHQRGQQAAARPQRLVHQLRGADQVDQEIDNARAILSIPTSSPRSPAVPASVWSTGQPRAGGGRNGIVVLPSWRSRCSSACRSKCPISGHGRRPLPWTR
jgi:multidrug efflux system membrane fusion protein